MELSDGLTAEIIMNLQNRSNTKQLLHRVVSYLNYDDLEMLYSVLTNSCSGDGFWELVQTAYFLQKYLNRVDRSFYYSFYEEKEYVDLEEMQMMGFANNYSKCFLWLPNQYKNILDFISSLFPSL